MSESIERGQDVLAVVAELLSYPDAAWRQGLGTVSAEVSELNDSAAQQVLSGFLDCVLKADPQEYEAQYVEAFDFSKKTSLYLTSRQRNDAAQQRADLLAYSLYFTESGFAPDHELPDYLPALLELASAVDGAEAVRILAGAHADLVLLHDALTEAGIDSYAALVGQVIATGDALEQEVAA